MLKSKKEKPFYEVVVQFGDIENCGFGQRNFEQAKQMLDEYMKEFEKRNPNMKVFNAVMHLDEATPHLHIDFLPVCHNQKQGLSTRISMKKALEEQGSGSFRKGERNRAAFLLYDHADRHRSPHFHVPSAENKPEEDLLL